MRVTSDGHDTKLVVRIPRLVPVHVRTLGVRITEIDELAVRGTVTRFALFLLVNTSAS